MKRLFTFFSIFFVFLLFFQICNDSIGHSLCHLALILLCLKQGSFLRICKKSTFYDIDHTRTSLQKIISPVSFCHPRPYNGKLPVQIGDVILENVAGTGVDIVATGNVKQIIQ